MWILQIHSISGLEQVYRGENRGHRAYSGEKSKKCQNLPKIGKFTYLYCLHFSAAASVITFWNFGC